MIVTNKDGTKVLQFGTGDISVASGYRSDDPKKLNNSILFFPIKKGMIGRNTHCEIQDLEPDTIMKFTKVESVQIVINALERVKAELMKQEENK